MTTVTRTKLATCESCQRNQIPTQALQVLKEPLLSQEPLELIFGYSWLVGTWFSQVENVATPANQSSGTINGIAEMDQSKMREIIASHQQKQNGR